MKRKTIASIFWGLIIIALGVILCGNALEIWDVSIFFPGWWTLFIIVPCLYWMATSGPDTGNVIGLTVGVLLLLNHIEPIGKYISWKLVLPLIIIVIGVKVLLSAFKKKDAHNDNTAHAEIDGKKPEVNFDGKVFDGGDYSCSFGELKIDLSNAIINQTRSFRVSCSFGSVKIYVPSNVSLVVKKSDAFFGEVKNNFPENQSGIPICLETKCYFGEIKIFKV